MNILIPDSWLREHLKSSASPKEIAKILSLTSVSVEKIGPARHASQGDAGGKLGAESVYDIEVTTNRADLMSIIGIAQEASVALSYHLKPAKFIPLKTKAIPQLAKGFPITIKNDPNLVNRICVVVMDVKIGKSPKIISDRLEASGIRSLNNLIDVTNYVMRETGHPTHVFDLDRLNTKSLTIKKSKRGETVQTLDGKTHTLTGEDIVAVDDNGRIVDLLGVMGTQNSVVTEETKRILFFVDNNNPVNIRNTSMNLGIRTEAAVINEKGIDPNLSMTALLSGIELFEKIAQGKVTSEILDIYPNKPETREVNVSLKKINDVIGVEIPTKESVDILNGLGFKTSVRDENILVTVPTVRLIDVKIKEDIIEEIARIYGYHKLPSIVPTFFNKKPYKFDNTFYFEAKIKNAMKYLGFNEVYTYSMVSEELFEGPVNQAIAIKNPLSEEMSYLRSSLIPSLLQVIEENKIKNHIKIFELANTYLKRKGDLPLEKLTLAGVIRKDITSFFEIKGIIEALMEDLGINKLKFKEKEEGIGAEIYIGSDKLGYIEVFNINTIDFELDFEIILKNANLKKTYKALSKFPPIIEDLSLEVNDSTKTIDLINEIKNQSGLISEVSLLDQFGNKKTFHIIYQDPGKNLTTQEVSKIREKVINALERKFNATIK